MLRHTDVPVKNNETTSNACILRGVQRSRKPALSLPKEICGGFCALWILFLASPLLVQAQFQPPTNEELKMTSDPKAPGAAAVYLYREEITDDVDHFHSFYARIKVLTEKGKQLATISVPYVPGADKVTKIEGRTIHPDGTVIPLTVKPDDLLAYKTKGLQMNALVFSLPSVEVGSILEYSFRYSGDTFAPTWWIQQPYFVHKAHYSFYPNLSGIMGGLLYTARIGSSEIVVKDKKGYFTLDIADVPPQPDEDWMLPINALLWRVEFYYSLFNSSKAFWDKSGQRWASSVLDFTNPSGHLKNAVAQIVAPTDTDEQKAAKIYAAVQKLENTRFTRAKSAAERKKDKLKNINKAEDVWKQQSGSDDDIALLYVALARAAGLKVWPMRVVDRSRALFDSTYLSTFQLDDYIVIVELGGKEIYLDPGQKMCPFGSLHWKHTLASGLRLVEKGAVIATTPANSFKQAVVQRIGDLYVNTDGSVRGTVRFVMTGPDALHWRQLALENDADAVKKLFEESIRDEVPDGVQASFDHLMALEDYETNLIAIVNVSGNLGTVTGKHFFLPGLFFQSHAKHPFVAQDKRITPIDLHYSKMEQDHFTYHLPPGYAVESAPQTSDVTWSNYAMLRIHSAVNDGSVDVDRLFAYGFTLLEPNGYNSLHDFSQKVAVADQQQLVLTHAAATKGN
jgi:hypothetical protein